MANEVIYFPFDEQKDSIFPQDEKGNGQAALLVPAGSVPPVVAQLAMGNGRQFDGTNIFVLSDSNAGGATREVAAFLIAEVDYASIGVGNTAYLLAHGEVTGGNTRYDWALRIEVLAADGTVRLRAVWHDDTGALVVPDGVLVSLPTSGEVLLGFTRFQDSDTIKVRYNVGVEFSADISSPATDPFDVYTAVGDADSRLWIAGTNDGAGAVAEAFHGKVTNALVVDEEVAGEEAALFWKAVTTLAAQARATWRAFKPRNVYSKDPDENVNAELRNEAGAFAFMKGVLSEVENGAFADTAYGDFLVRWENLLRISPGATDSIAERRARVLAHTQNVLGYSKESIRLQLRELFGFVNASDVTILEVDNTYDEDWTTDQRNNWLETPGPCTISYNGVSDAIDIDYATTTDDLRYKGPEWSTGEGPGMVLFPVGDVIDPDNYLIVELDVSAFTRGGTEVIMAGIVVGDRINDDWLFFGYGDLGGGGGVGEVGYTTYRDNAMTNAVILDDSYALPTTLTVRYRNGLYFIKADDTIRNDEASGVAGPTAPGWVGMALVCPNDNALMTQAANTEMTNFTVVDRNGRQRNNWYAYRNPAASSNPYSLEKAQRLIDRIEPSTTRGRAIDQQDELTCDDASALTSRDFIGKIGGGL